MATKFGYFLIADITGYTQYLSASELDHAQKTLTALLNLLINHTKPPLIISRLAGDAVISYGLRDNFVLGQTFVEMLEDTYVSFRRAIELMVRNTTCPCNACRNIGSLDLKFFVHYGEFGVQRLDRHDELVGSDVNLIHRLLKNSVKETTGIAAYTMYSEAAIRALGLDEATAGFVSHDEAYEHLGTVHTFIQDMHPVWEMKRREAQVLIKQDEHLLQLSIEIAAPRERVWEGLSRPEFASVMLGGNKIEIVQRRAGQIAQGSQYLCYHGENIIQNTILEWLPFERLVFQFVMPVPLKGVTALVEVALAPCATGTRVVQTYSKARGPLVGRLMANRGLKAMKSGFEQCLSNFKTQIEADYKGRQPTESAESRLTVDDIAAAARAALQPA
jgi:uncharacterized protein YndB with AHSA1/START domain